MAHKRDGKKADTRAILGIRVQREHEDREEQIRLKLAPQTPLRDWLQMREEVSDITECPGPTMVLSRSGACERLHA